MTVTELSVRQRRGLMRPVSGEPGGDFCFECGRWHAPDDCPETDQEQGKKEEPA